MIPARQARGLLAAFAALLLAGCISSTATVGPSVVAQSPDSVASTGPKSSINVSADYADGLPMAIGGERVYRVADVARLDPSRAHLVAAWDRGSLPISCPAQFPGATSTCRSPEGLSDSPTGPAVLTASWPPSLAVSPAMVVQAQIVPLPSCWSDPAGGCPTIPTIEALGVAWQGSGAGSVPWSGLARPLRLPVVSAGAPCPRTGGGHIVSGVSDGLGGGPVYPVGLGLDGRLAVTSGPLGFAGKVLWIASPAYSGPILVRGGRIDGSGTLAFSSDGGQLEQQLRLQPGPLTGGPPELPSDWSAWPTEANVSAPGCYAFQVDGLEFTTLIAFEATVALGG